MSKELLSCRDRDEEWGTGGGNSGSGNTDNKDYDGPAGMDVDGVIESTWTEVSHHALYSQKCHIIFYK